ncbi:hypothetical protein [Priestia megaterium]|uniref:Uncharacterized protein n=1 Tax=Priestia megaterium TaxID=1404 RepID=A0A6M6E8N9_PRIMG|nr:hypothetical protein [Priestia megaterium]QJX80788.1 hypothetical protein FDZ14_32375 [Priestia megaterium]
MKETTNEQTKLYIHNLIGYTVCVLFVFITFFVVLLFDYDFRFKALGWLFNIIDKAASLIPYSREPDVVATPAIWHDKGDGTW